jgi:hypothetical protein
VNYDPATLDSLATFNLRGQSLSVSAYSVGQ